MQDVHSQGTYYFPYGYDDNKIVLMIKDPHWLYAYWEISNAQKNAFFHEFGYELWERSIPVLKITNVTKSTHSFIKINDLANNWYINVEDSNCLYTVELGRRISDKFFINLANSNCILTPSDQYSTNTSAYFVNYKDMKHYKYDYESNHIYDTYPYQMQYKGMFGFSSQELLGLNMGESMFGISSFEPYYFNITEHLDKSSSNFI